MEPGRRAPARSAEERRRRLSRALGIVLPAFEAPLEAFRTPDRERENDPVYLGGDLHAVDPKAGPAGRLGPYDPTLEIAKVMLGDGEHESIETSALEGVWCLPIPREMTDTAPYFTLWDSEARLRHWLLLPAPRTMVGFAQLWLPAVGRPTDRPDTRDPRPSR